MAKRRFIAGAVCPQCRALDRLVVETVSETVERRSCVACGYVEEMRPGGVRVLPRGRLERPSSAPDDVAPVKVIDPDR